MSPSGVKQLAPLCSCSTLPVVTIDTTSVKQLPCLEKQVLVYTYKTEFLTFLMAQFFFKHTVHLFGIRYINMLALEAVWQCLLLLHISGGRAISR